MIDAIVINLERGKYLLENIDDKKYTDKTIAPYHSSIGGHIRHVLDVFACVFKGLNSELIDLTQRDRNNNVESFTKYGIAYFDRIITQLNGLDTLQLTKTVCVIDDLGNGTCKVQSTLGAVLAQAQSHAIHHFATIGYMMHVLGIKLPIDSFGVNPTTPKQNLVQQS